MQCLSGSGESARPNPISVDRLVHCQNRDGGWPFIRGASWSEPTAYAILALQMAGETDACRRGVQWLRRIQRPDGSWPPHASIDESTWVTALVAWLTPEIIGEQAHRRAIRWLTDVKGEESSLVFRAREWLLGNPRQPEMEFPGWPWLPGTAAWVSPTAVSILALQKDHARQPDSRLQERIDEGRKFLLLHMCREGGWNHGSVRALGYESRPYPETTGLALASLRGVRSPKIDSAVAVARNFLKDCRSADACNWLRLGLLTHGQLPEGYCPPPELQFRTTVETSLDLLATAAITKRTALFA
jgi:squalene-hopene cyclase-like protein